MKLTLSVVDSMLDGDEPIIVQMINEVGPMAANEFVLLFNNACMQMAGFEDFYTEHSQRFCGFYAPITNLSFTEH